MEEFSSQEKLDRTSNFSVKIQLLQSQATIVFGNFLNRNPYWLQALCFSWVNISKVSLTHSFDEFLIFYWTELAGIVCLKFCFSLHHWIQEILDVNTYSRGSKNCSTFWQSVMFSKTTFRKRSKFGYYMRFS